MRLIPPLRDWQIAAWDTRPGYVDWIGVPVIATGICLLRGWGPLTGVALCVAAFTFGPFLITWLMWLTASWWGADQ